MIDLGRIIQFEVLSIYILHLDFRSLDERLTTAYYTLLIALLLLINFGSGGGYNFTFLVDRLKL